MEQPVYFSVTPLTVVLCTYLYGYQDTMYVQSVRMHFIPFSSQFESVSFLLAVQLYVKRYKCLKQSVHLHLYIFQVCLLLGGWYMSCYQYWSEVQCFASLTVPRAPSPHRGRADGHLQQVILYILNLNGSKFHNTKTKKWPGLQLEGIFKPQRTFSLEYHKWPLDQTDPFHRRHFTLSKQEKHMYTTNNDQ